MQRWPNFRDGALFVPIQSRRRETKKQNREISHNQAGILSAEALANASREDDRDRPPFDCEPKTSDLVDFVLEYLVLVLQFADEFGFDRCELIYWHIELPALLVYHSWKLS